jgi:hypothetical protein
MSRPLVSAHFTFCPAVAMCAVWATFACCQEGAKAPSLNKEVERCRRINNEHIRMQCFEQINSKTTPVPQQQPTPSGTWQLARTPNPSGGPDSISITKITNPTASEQHVAGLMLRCAEGATTAVLIVLAEPLPLRPSQSGCCGGRNNDGVHRKRCGTRSFGTASGEGICSCREDLAIRPRTYRGDHGGALFASRCNTTRRHHHRDSDIAVELSKGRSRSQVGDFR